MGRLGFMALGAVLGIVGLAGISLVTAKEKKIAVKVPAPSPFTGEEEDKAEPVEETTPKQAENIETVEIEVEADIDTESSEDEIDEENSTADGNNK